MPSPTESVVQTFLTKERQWTSISSIPASSSSSLPLFHGLPEKRVYISPDDQKRYLRATANIKAELHLINHASIERDDEISREEWWEGLKTQLSQLEAFYTSPRREFVACVPQTSRPDSGQPGNPVDYVSGDVLDATFTAIKPVKDSVDSGLDPELQRVAEQILWERGREKGETEPPKEPPQRLLLAVVDTDSTIGFYFVHEGMVPPRQN